VSAFRFALATADDDARLRARMAGDRMDGRIAVSFRREPSFFAGCVLQGDRSETIVCTDMRTGELVGLGSRTSALAYLNGHEQRIGYLSDLRCAPEYRRGLLLARGYRFLRQRHDDDPVPFYTTVIYEGNAVAFDTLTGQRAGLPIYRDHGRLRTPAIRLDRSCPEVAHPGVTMVQASVERLPEILRFLNARMATRQFAPVFGEQDLSGGRLSGMRATDFLLAERSGAIVGTVALWDQSALRQTHVEEYRGVLGHLRPLYNFYAALSHKRPLPAPGSRIAYVYLACFAVADDNLDIARVLLRAAYRAARRGPWQYAIAGLHERDLLAPLLDEYPRIEAAGRLFVVHYPEQADVAARLDARVPYLEAGCL